MKRPYILAITGKGGVGKTSITVLIAKALSEMTDYRLLLIDADPTHPHLCEMINLHPKKSIENVRKKLIKQVSRSDVSISDVAHNIDFAVYNALTENKQFSLFSIGQPEGPGCFCPSNTLLRNVIENISRDFDIVLIDCEAGLEQIHRQVIKSIDYLVIVVDLSLRSIETANSIKNSAKKYTNYNGLGVIINKVRGDIQLLRDRMEELNLTLIGAISEDSNIMKYDLQGTPLIYLPQNTISFTEIQDLVKRVFFIEFNSLI